MSLKNISALCFFIVSCVNENNEKQVQTNDKQELLKKNKFLKDTCHLSQKEIKNNQNIFKNYSLKNLKELWENSFKDKKNFMFFLTNKFYDKKNISIKALYKQSALNIYKSIKEITKLDDKDVEFSQFKKYIDDQVSKIEEDDDKISGYYKGKIKNIFGECFNMIFELKSTKQDKKQEFYSQYKLIINSETELKQAHLKKLEGKIINIFSDETNIINKNVFDNYKLVDQSGIKLSYNNHAFKMTNKDCGLTENTNIENCKFIQDLNILKGFIEGQKEKFQKKFEEFDTFMKQDVETIFDKRFDWIRSSKNTVCNKLKTLLGGMQDQFIIYYLECLTIYFEKQIQNTIVKFVKEENTPEQTKNIYDNIKKIINLSSDHSVNNSKNIFGDVLVTDFIKQLENFIVSENKIYSNIDSYFEYIFQSKFFINRNVTYKFIIESFENYGNCKFWEILEPIVKQLDDIKTAIDNDFYIGNIGSFDTLKRYLNNLSTLQKTWADCKNKLKDHFIALYGGKNITDTKDENPYYFIYKYFEELICNTQNMSYNRFNIGQYVLIKKDSYNKDKQTIFTIDNKEALKRLIELFFYDDYSANDKTITFHNGLNTIQYKVTDDVSEASQISINTINMNINSLTFSDIISLTLCDINKTSHGIILHDSGTILNDKQLEENKNIFNSDIDDLRRLLGEEMLNKILSIKLFDHNSSQEYTLSYRDREIYKTRKNY